MKTSLAIGVDIGGTKIAFALIDAQGRLIAQHRLPTLPAEGSAAIVGRIREGIAVLQRQAAAPIVGIGIGAPGHVDSSQGVIHNAVNLHWEEFPLLEHLRPMLNLPIYVMNDVYASLSGEMYFGVAQGKRDVVYLAVGTGLGGAALSEGQLVRGAGHFAMEAGHIPLFQLTRRCACGLVGCPEMYASGKGILAGVAEHLPEYPQSSLTQLSTLTTQAIIAAAQQGDPLAVAVFAEARQVLAQVMVYCAGAFNPSQIIVGGGMAQAAGDLLLAGIAEQVKAKLLPAISDPLQIVTAQLSDPAIGAASLVWHNRDSFSTK